MNHPVAATFIKNAVKNAAPSSSSWTRAASALAPRLTASRLQARHRRGDAQRDAPHDHRGGAQRRAVHRRLHGGLRGAEGEASATSRRSGWRRSAASTPRPCGRSRGSTPARARRSSSGAWASRQHVHGTDNARCLIALALITGQIGRPGHRPASAARPEQRPGRLRRRADPDGLSGLPVGREAAGPEAVRGRSGASRSIRSAGSPSSRS